MRTNIKTFPDSFQKEGQGKWDAFLEAARIAGFRESFPSRFRGEAVRVFALSDFFTRNALRYPETLVALFRTGDLDRTYPDTAYAASIQGTLEAIHGETELGRFCRQFRRREMMRIAWRDLLGFSDLFETMADLTRLADVLIQESLRVLYSRQCAESGVPKNRAGKPQEPVVIGMGKLGGEELNFSSDVDLIFAFPEAGRTTGTATAISNDQFFSALCRRLIRLLGNPTEEGIVFRVDTRLRPDGENGPIVMSFDNMEYYYQHHGREWERYAWIKGRPVAGNRAAGKALIRRLNPFIYRRYLDYGIFEALRDMKRKISLEVKRKGLEDDVKLGPGGIREIEFFGQVFQLIRGGVFPPLQTRRILDVLDILSEQGIILSETRRTLHDAYVFFRMTEHRLQEFSDQQTHRLPRDPLSRLRLAVSMGFADWPAFVERLDTHRKGVHEHFRGLLKSEVAPAPAGPAEERILELANVWHGPDSSGRVKNALAKSGLGDPDAVFNVLEHLKADPATRALSHEGRRRLDRLMPLVLQAAADSESPLTTLSRACDLIRTIERRTSYLSLLLENPSALTHLMNLINASPWIAAFLRQHPVLLDELMDTRILYRPPQKTALEKELEDRIAPLDPDDLEVFIETLCIFKQVNTLRVAASDITGVLPLMRVSDHLTHIAEVILDTVLKRVWDHLTAKHGKPRCIIDGRPCERGFVMIAYGKLGGIELGYRSDLDLVFLHAGAPGQTDGGRSVDNAQFFARLGQRVIHILTTHTRAGTLYEIDMRLRPSGASGILVSHIDAFREYELHQAWTWEHQALVRARAIGGDPLLVQGFESVRKAVLTRPREEGSLRKAVREMRERMRKAHLKPEPGVFDLKEARGGMVDVEFIVQYLVLLYAHRYPRIVEWTDNVRLIQSLMESGVLDEQTAYLLRRAFLVYRATLHRLNLQEKPARIPSDRFAALRKGIRRIWTDLLED